MESSTQEVLEQQEDPVHSSFASPLEVCKNFLLFLPWLGRTTLHHQGSVVPLLWVRDEVFAESRLMGIVEVWDILMVQSKLNLLHFSLLSISLYCCCAHLCLLMVGRMDSLNLPDLGKKNKTCQRCTVFYLQIVQSQWPILQVYEMMVNDLIFCMLACSLPFSLHWGKVYLLLNSSKMDYFYQQWKSWPMMEQNSAAACVWTHLPSLSPPHPANHQQKGFCQGQAYNLGPHKTEMVVCLLWYNMDLNSCQLLRAPCHHHFLQRGQHLHQPHLMLASHPAALLHQAPSGKFQAAVHLRYLQSSSLE